MLDAEGFVWVVREPYEQVPWDQRLGELVLYKEERGTCVVPKNTAGYEQLALCTSMVVYNLYPQISCLSHNTS